VGRRKKWYWTVRCNIDIVLDYRYLMDMDLASPYAPALK
jgi:hypothetical protein